MKKPVWSRLCAAEILSPLQKSTADVYEYRGLGQYPVMLGQQVLRFFRLQVEKQCFLTSLSVWSRSDPPFPLCPVSEEPLVQLWNQACSVASFCWQEGLWHCPSIRPQPDVYSVWVHGPLLFRLVSVHEDWHSALTYLLNHYESQEWLEGSLFASLWFFFLDIVQYYQHTKAEEFLPSMISCSERN